jgi:hypothetical protein
VEKDILGVIHSRGEKDFFFWRENSESWTRERFVFGIYTLDRGC